VSDCLFVCVYYYPTKTRKIPRSNKLCLVSNYTAHLFPRNPSNKTSTTTIWEGGNGNYVFIRCCFRIYLSHPTNNQLTDWILSFLSKQKKPVHIILTFPLLFLKNNFVLHYISRAPFGRTLNTRIFANRFCL
jgi:hypothetical protein